MSTQRRLDMPSLEDLKSDISRLSDREFRRLRRWFLAQDAAAWDGEIEDDVRSGRLDRRGEEALRDLADGRTSRL